MSISDSDDSGSLNSMLHVKASELYPKKTLNETEDSYSIPPPFAPLCGEAIEYIARISEGVLALSNYRIYYQRTGKDGKGDFNIPLGLIELAEIKDLFHIYINCKDARTYRCSFPSNDVCVDWFRKLGKAIAPPKNIDELFTFVYYAWASEEGGEEISSYLGRDVNVIVKDNFKSEIKRLRFEIDSTNWRVSSVNVDYKLCPSYPKCLIVPATVTDQALEAASKFRSSRRVPAVVWRHKENGMIIARCSQPEVGWLGWRSSEDEELLKALADACFQKSSANSTSASKKTGKVKLLVMDARSYTTAVANRARGGGCECHEYYPNCVILFMNLANIHSIRKSFHALRQLCASPPDLPNWHSMLEGTKWLPNMSLLIQAAVRVATALEKDAQPVLVHCSDGWDRTSQIVSLAELLLDPYYRTVEGFQVLCEREWLDFGHKFADRCGIGEDVNEKCPVFLQWLDCVHNILEQFPCAFEFSKRYLIKLAEHTYSNLFGTFLCNTNAERQNLGIAQRTFSVWRYLNSPHFRNYLYNPNFEKVLWPKFNVRDLEVWRDLYIDLAYDNQCPNDSSQLINTEDNQIIVSNGESEDKNQPQEIVENGNLNNLGNNLGSMLESAINCQPDVINDHIIANGEDASDTDYDGNDCCADINLVNGGVVGDAEHALMSTSTTTPAAINNAFSDKPDDDNNANYDNVNYDVVATENSVNNYRITSDNDTAINISREYITTTLDVQKNVFCDIVNKNNLNNTSNKEDCDILSDRNVANSNSEDCNGIVDELEMRLNGSDTSVQTSVETIIDNNFAVNLINESNDYKTVTNGLKQCDTSACLSSGRQQLTSLFLDPIDGLPLIPDDIQDRMQQLSIEHKAQQAALRSELHTTRYALMSKICHQCIHQNSNPPEKQIVSDDDKGSVCSTEISWEAVDEKDVGQVLWVPDYAVNFCTSCNSRFWLGRRKHHCRGCGKIFCADCSRNVTSLPNEQLFDPVRVCEDCYQIKRVSPCLSYSNSPRQTTCKQAAAKEEPQNSGLVLPRAPQI